MSIKQIGENKYKIRLTTRLNGRRVEKMRVVQGSKGMAVSIEKELLKSIKEYKKNISDEIQRYPWSKAVTDYLYSAEGRLSSQTYYVRKTALEAHTDAWSNRPTSSIGREEIIALVGKLESSDSTKEIILKYIRQVFEEAVLCRKVAINPAKGLRIFKDKSQLKKANDLSAMSKDEIQKLLCFFKDISEDWYSIFFVTYQLGLRFSEAVALQFCDIDFETGNVTISKSWDRFKKDTVPPKNGRSRIVNLNPQTALFLKKLRSTANHDSDWVLPRLNPWLKGEATKVIQKAQEELKIKKTNYHSLRASFITHLLLAGESIVKVQAMVGHSDLKTTMRYIRLSGSDLAGATKALELELDNKGKVLPFNNKSKIDV